MSENNELEQTQQVIKKPLTAAQEEKIDEHNKQLIRDQNKVKFNFADVGADSVYGLPLLRAGTFYSDSSNPINLVGVNVKIKTFYGKNYSTEAWMEKSSMLISNGLKRNYEIRYATFPEKGKARIFSRLNYKEQIGNAVHELGHIVQYTNMNRRGLAYFLKSYTNLDQRKFWENDADAKAIHTGAGEYLLAWREKTWDSLQKQKVGKTSLTLGDIYQSPQELESKIKAYDKGEYHLLDEKFIE
jgi:hypothetical protein